MKMECPNCEGTDFCITEEEHVCNKCGSTFILEYIGCYPDDDGGNAFFGDGYEPKWWKEKYKFNDIENGKNNKIGGIRICPSCSGTGMKKDKACGRCHGNGKYRLYGDGTLK